MKRFLIVGMLLLFGSTVFAQIVVDGKDIADMELKYVQILAVQKFMSQKVTVIVDYGQKVKWGSAQRMEKPDGKPLVFMSVIHALNYMDKNGWDYVNNYTIAVGGQNVYHYLFKKKEDGQG